MTFVNAGTLGTVSGHRDELVATLTQRNDLLHELGCSVYEVGINADAPDTVFVVEVWDSQEAHGRSLEHPKSKRRSQPRDQFCQESSAVSGST